MFYSHVPFSDVLYVFDSCFGPREETYRIFSSHRGEDALFINDKKVGGKRKKKCFNGAVGQERKTNEVENCSREIFLLPTISRQFAQLY